MRRKSWLHEKLICYQLHVQPATSGFRRIRWRGRRHSKFIHSNRRICAVFRLRLTDTVNNRRDHIRICQGPVAKRPGELTAERHGNNRRDKIRVYQALVAENRFSSEGHGNNRREKRSGYNREAMSRRRPLSLDRERETHGQNS
jgi:hypothetical protein